MKLPVNPRGPPAHAPGLGSPDKERRTGARAPSGTLWLRSRHLLWLLVSWFFSIASHECSKFNDAFC
ncbi:MAG: hypothetical protein KAY08_04635 [Giesbergeria sp.]|nr:hypothetical protein [Giesbergeria sp.]